MVQIVVVVREPDRLKPDHTLKFDLPEVPKTGSYISIQRPDHPEPFGEDMIVRQVWWRLRHPQKNGAVSDTTEKIGTLREIFVECDPALSPYSSDNWRHALGDGKNPDIEVLEVVRYDAREADLKLRTLAANGCEP
ncbi:MAG: hypothetical protein KGL29_04975 [Alphaproteobacteria bacterium]|nr:hypothetical protein [Alphaproteobacteria bacterium]